MYLLVLCWRVYIYNTVCQIVLSQALWVQAVWQWLPPKYSRVFADPRIQGVLRPSELEPRVWSTQNPRSHDWITSQFRGYLNGSLWRFLQNVKGERSGAFCENCQRHGLTKCDKASIIIIYPCASCQGREYSPHKPLGVTIGSRLSSEATWMAVCDASYKTWKGRGVVLSVKTVIDMVSQSVTRHPLS